MISSLRMLQIALVGGIVYLASNGLDGWGWLVFILFITIDKNE
jgi:hypothetical protein